MRFRQMSVNYNLQLRFGTSLVEICLTSGCILCGRGGVFPRSLQDPERLFYIEYIKRMQNSAMAERLMNTAPYRNLLHSEVCF